MSTSCAPLIWRRALPRRIASDAPALPQKAPPWAARTRVQERADVERAVACDQGLEPVDGVAPEVRDVVQRPHESVKVGLRRDRHHDDDAAARHHGDHGRHCAARVSEVRACGGQLPACAATH